MGASLLALAKSIYYCYIVRPKISVNPWRIALCFSTVEILWPATLSNTTERFEFEKWHLNSWTREEVDKRRCKQALNIVFLFQNILRRKLFQRYKPVTSPCGKL